MLYHKEIGFPVGIVESLHGKSFDYLNYTTHARNACMTDRYGVIDNIPTKLTLDKDKIIELDIDDGEVMKIVTRVPYNEIFDIIVVLLPHTHVVKTVWLNSVKDKHSTLDRSKYSKP